MSEESWKNLLHAHIDGCLSKFDKLIQQQLRTWGLSSSFSIQNDSALSLLISKKSFVQVNNIQKYCSPFYQKRKKNKLCLGMGI